MQILYFHLSTECECIYPDLHVGPLAQPLLPRLGGRELRYFFAVQLQDAGVLVSHDLQGGGVGWGAAHRVRVIVGLQSEDPLTLMLLHSPHLSEEERHHVRRLPVGGVEEVRQRHSGESRQRVGAVESEVQPLGAPPTGCN